MNENDFTPLDDLDQKAKKNFSRKIVRKTYAAKSTELKHFPAYVSEFLLSKYANEEGIVTSKLLEEVRSDLIAYSPKKRSKEAHKSAAMEMGSLVLIDHYEVFTDLLRGKYYTRINSIDEYASVNSDLINPSKFPNLLKGGLWGKAKFQYMRRGDGFSLNMNDFDSYQTGGVILQSYKAKRSAFSTDEWISFLIRTIGFNPTVMNLEEKLYYICRLIPYVECSINMLELGPPGTGKSFIFENMSEYARLILGGDISEAKLIYDLMRRRNGLVFTKDIICFDEINKTKSKFKEMIPRLQQLMASNRVERGEMEAITDVSLVFQGNILDFTTVNNQVTPKHSDYLKRALPAQMVDSPFLDRIHMFIHGWKLPAVSQDQLNDNLGLISNYFGQILHKIRYEDLNLFIEENLTFFCVNKDNERASLSLRDRNALYHTISGLIKLIFPDKEVTSDEWKMMAALALTLRQNVIDEIIKLDETQTRILNFEFRSEKIPSNHDIEIADLIQSTDIYTEKLDTISFSIPKKSRICVNQDQLLTRKIPYYLLKLLLDDNLLSFKENHLMINKEMKGVPKALTSGKKAIQLNNLTQVDPQFYLNEEEQLKQIEKVLVVLSNKIDHLGGVIHKLNILKARIYPRLKETSENFVEQIEQIENNIPIKLSQLRGLEHCIENELNLIQKSLGKQPDLLTTNYKSIIQLGTEIISNYTSCCDELSNSSPHWLKEYEELSTRIEADVDLTFKEKKLFGGEKFPLFAFDVNNLVVSMKKKFPTQSRLLRNINPLKRINDDYLKNKPYLAYMFASKNLESLKREIKEDQYNKWYIESYYKDRYEGVYVDIDTALTGMIFNIIEQHHDQISHFYLGSGDKDLHIVLDLAKKYNIETSVIVIQEANLSRELKTLADNVILLY